MSPALLRRRLAALLSVTVGVLSGLCAALLAMTLSAPALAGHTFGTGDCWKQGTPTLCRSNWRGRNTILYVDLVDQLNNSTLRAQAETARYNWTVAPHGPQNFIWRTGALVNPPVYMKINNSLPVGQGRSRNYDINGFPCLGACMIFHSDVEVPVGNASLDYSTSIFAHELGHTLGLYEHNIYSDAAMMNQGTLLTGPTLTDAGPLPPCSGSSSYKGVRCIYDWNY